MTENSSDAKGNSSEVISLMQSTIVTPSKLSTWSFSKLNMIGFVYGLGVLFVVFRLANWIPTEFTIPWFDGARGALHCQNVGDWRLGVWCAIGRLFVE